MLSRIVYITGKLFVAVWPAAAITKFIWWAWLPNDFILGAIFGITLVWTYDAVGELITVEADHIEPDGNA